MKKTVKYVLLLAVCLLMLAGCGKEKSPDGISVLLNGEEVSVINVMAGCEDIVLTTKITPADFNGNLTWASEDSGIAKVTSYDNSGCTITVKKAGSTVITAKSGEMTVSVKLNIEKDITNLSSKDIAMTINGVNYSVDMVNIYFVEEYYNFVDEYGDYAYYYGLDTSYGIEGLASQACDYVDDENGTWKDFFLQSAVTEMAQIQALCDYGSANGISLDDDEMAMVDEEITDLSAIATENGYESIDAYLHEVFGDGINEAYYRTYCENMLLADKVYNSYYESLSYTDEQIDEYFATLGYEEGDYDYNLTSMRHLLIMAEADENGEYTDEAIAAAHDRAVELYEEWRAGEATEDSFATMANEYSDDTGSTTNGGYYYDIYKGEMVEGIDTWLFQDERESGDVEIIDNNGSYVGTHIVYFVEKGEVYKTAIAKSDLNDIDIEAWFEVIMEDYTIEKGQAFSKIGVF